MQTPVWEALRTSDKSTHWGIILYACGYRSSSDYFRYELTTAVGRNARNTKVRFENIIVGVIKDVHRRPERGSRDTDPKRGTVNGPSRYPSRLGKPALTVMRVVGWTSGSCREVDEAYAGVTFICWPIDTLDGLQDDHLIRLLGD